MKGTLGLVLGASLLLVGCSSSHGETAAQVAAKVSGLVCSPPTYGETEVMNVKPVARLDCTINGQSVTIDQYANAQQAGPAEAVKSAKDACPLFKAHGITSVSGVFGKYWVVSTPSSALAAQIQHAEGDGTKVITVDC